MPPIEEDIEDIETSMTSIPITKFMAFESEERVCKELGKYYYHSTIFSFHYSRNM